MWWREAISGRLSLSFRKPALARWPIAAALAWLATLPLPGNRPAAEEGVAIGVAGPMSGRFAWYGRQLRAGAELAVHDLNARGGILGRRIALHTADDHCEAERARPAAEILTQRGVQLIVGHYCAGASLAASAVYGDAGILQIMPAIAPAPLRRGNGGALAFSLSGASPGQGEIAARFLSERAQGTRIAIIHDKTVYGRSLAEAVQQGLGDQARIVFAEAVRPAEKDYAATIARLEAAGAEFVYFGGQATEAALIVRQMRQAGLTAVLMSGDALSDRSYWELAGPAGEGTLITFTRSGRTLPSVAELSLRLEERGVDPGSYALRAYAAVQLWAAAAEAARSLEPASVAAHLAAAPLETMLGPVRFTELGEGDLPFYSVHEWRDGALREIE